MRLTNPQSFNRYSYVGNDPVNLIDPSGLDATPDCGPGTEPRRDAQGNWQCVGTGNTPVHVPIPRDDAPIPEINPEDLPGGGVRTVVRQLPTSPQNAGQQDPKQKGGQPCKSPSPAVRSELNDLLQNARRASKEAKSKVQFKSSFSPVWAAVEGVGSTVIWSAIKKAPLTALEVGGSLGVGVGVHALFSFLRDYRNWEVERENAGLAGFQEVMHSGVKRIEQKYGVLLPNAHLWPFMNPCR